MKEKRYNRIFNKLITKLEKVPIEKWDHNSTEETYVKKDCFEFSGVCEHTTFLKNLKVTLSPETGLRNCPLKVYFDNSSEPSLVFTGKSVDNFRQKLFEDYRLYKNNPEEYSKKEASNKIYKTNLKRLESFL
jgi:hypothetical protein